MILRKICFAILLAMFPFGNGVQVSLIVTIFLISICLQLRIQPFIHLLENFLDLGSQCFLIVTIIVFSLPNPNTFSVIFLRWIIVGIGSAFSMCLLILSMRPFVSIRFGAKRIAINDGERVDREESLEPLMKEEN